MTRIETACYCLLASAFTLAGILLVQLQPHLGSSAEAEMVITEQNFTLMTAFTRRDEEALFLLDDRTERLVIYTHDAARKQLQVAGVVDVARLFRGGGGGADAGGRSGR